MGQYKFRSASFNEDARGRWYFNVVVDGEVEPSKGQDRIGIELGLADTAFRRHKIFSRSGMAV